MWSPQHYIEQGTAKGIAPEVLKNSVAQIEQVLEKLGNIPAILSLNHLARRTEVPYLHLRVVTMRLSNPYRHFTIRKRSGGRRTISVPRPDIMQVQRWLTAHVLNPQPVHRCSYAFKPGSSIVGCAARHTGARWLVKMDIAGFFGSISEIQVFRVFRQIGYQPLVAFELARLTTCVTLSPWRYEMPRWQNRGRHKIIAVYQDGRIGHLPQGAPTSPMLSNLVMRDVDAEIEAAANAAGLAYTRYSDDMIFSTRGDFSRARAVKFIEEVSAFIRRAGLYPQKRKTVIVPPGARKVVLGLVVDGATPRLPREFRDSLRQHLHYLEKFGPAEHMKRREFETIQGMRHHIRGLIDFARMVDSPYAEAMLRRFEGVEWPV